MMTNSKSIHRTVLTGFYLLAGIGLIAGGLTYILASNWLKEVMKDNEYVQAWGMTDFITWGVVLLVLGAVDIFFSYKLYRHSKAALKIAFGFSVVAVIWSIFGLVAYGGYENIFFLLLHLYFLWALKKELFNYPVPVS
ncbi:MAG: hypothetical protein AAGE93_23815 [Bacteroidota bacterium]